MKQKLAFVFAVLLTAGVLNACGTSEPATESTTETTVETAADLTEQTTAETEYADMEAEHPSGSPAASDGTISEGTSEEEGVPEALAKKETTSEREQFYNDMLKLAADTIDENLFPGITQDNIQEMKDILIGGFIDVGDLPYNGMDMFNSWIIENGYADKWNNYIVENSPSSSTDTSNSTQGSSSNNTQSSNNSQSSGTTTNQPSKPAPQPSTGQQQQQQQQTEDYYQQQEDSGRTDLDNGNSGYPTYEEQAETRKEAGGTGTGGGAYFDPELWT